MNKELKKRGIVLRETHPTQLDSLLKQKELQFITTNNLSRQSFFFVTVPIGRSRLGTVPNPESATQEGRDKLDFRGINNKNFDRSNMRDIVQTSDDYVAAGDDGTATVDVLRQKHAESEDIRILGCWCFNTWPVMITAS